MANEPTPIAVPAELAALAEVAPELIAGLRRAREAGERVAPLTEREIELIRIGVMVAISAPAASYRSHVARALDAGASADDVWGVVAAIATIVGVPRILEASPHVAAALGEAQ